MPKSSNSELRTRIRVIQSWILEDNTYSDIIRSSISTWNIGSRQAARYYKIAYAFFEEGQEKNIERKKAYYLSRKRKLIKEMHPVEKRTAAGAVAINKILDSMMEIEGLKVNKVEVTGKDGGPINHTSKVVIIDSGPDPVSSEKDIDLERNV